MRVPCSRPSRLVFVGHPEIDLLPGVALVHRLARYSRAFGRYSSAGCPGKRCQQEARRKRESPTCRAGSSVPHQALHIGGRGEVEIEADGERRLKIDRERRVVGDGEYIERPERITRACCGVIEQRNRARCRSGIAVTRNPAHIPGPDFVELIGGNRGCRPASGKWSDTVLFSGHRSKHPRQQAWWPTSSRSLLSASSTPVVGRRQVPARWRTRMAH